MKYAMPMSKMIQLRNVPDVLHRTLKARAAMAGMSLSDYLLAEIKEVADRPTLAELRERLHEAPARDGRTRHCVPSTGRTRGAPLIGVFVSPTWLGSHLIRVHYTRVIIFGLYGG